MVSGQSEGDPNKLQRGTYIICMCMRLYKYYTSRMYNIIASERSGVEVCVHVIVLAVGHYGMATY